MNDQKIIDWIKKRAPRALWGEGRGAPRLLHCGDPSAEYAALRTGAVLAPLPGWSQMLAEGPDAIDYLHRRLTQSIKTLETGSGAHALLLGGDGRMQGDFAIWRGEEAAMLATSQACAETAYLLLEKFILIDRVEMTRFWINEPMIALIGPRAPGILAGLMDPRPDPQRLANDPWAAWFTVNLAGLPCRVFGEGRFGVPYYHLSVPPMALEPMLSILAEACGESGNIQSSGIAGEWALELLRIEAGTALFGADADERTIPLEAGLEDAISFDKGCYPGQEILARIRNLGHPARVLARLTLDEEHELKRGAPLRIDGEEAGMLTSSICWPGLGRTEGLGNLKWDRREATEATIATESGELAMRVRHED